ncbi:MAG: flagellar hook-basal body complex protein, partial [Proteobacteria bacterium]|nr:flagellar hook-basal body complex protein [Pseudomonadota bacterium]
MKSLSIAATGMLAQQTYVDVIANNIANMNTTGFKRQRPEFQDLLYQNLAEIGVTSSDSGTVVPSGVQLGTGVRTASVYRITEQGNLVSTGNSLDLAIQGKGFFTIELPNGDTAYTRAGTFQLSPQGQIVTLDVKVGDVVRKHQVLGLLNQPELVQRLQQEQARLAEMKARDKKLLALRAQRANLEKRSIEANRLRLHSRIKSTTAMAEAQRAKSEEYFAKQDENLAKLKEVTQKLGQTVEERYEHKRQAYSQGLATDTEVLDARRTFFDNRVKLADIELRVHELELRRIDAEDSYHRQMELVADFHAEIEKLDIEASKVDQLDLETVSDSKLRIQEIERNIERYDKQLATKGQIVSE